MLEGPFRRMDSNPLFYRRPFCKKKNWTDKKRFESQWKREVSGVPSTFARKNLGSTKNQRKSPLKKQRKLCGGSFYLRIRNRRTVKSPFFKDRFENRDGLPSTLTLVRKSERIHESY
ncbi:hypothetical protein DLM75_23345 [Leptospira stimsonii]|uniref:Uncharacterized protein n=1 Tax=Leptospira stimsonii TaxID=2202203 RepID=A0A396YLF6_9LEPT|nr:hypothetical protein DLM75_23345 [Leptospira stimsonii]